MREIEIVKVGKKNLMYPDNVTRMFATSNLEKFSDALQRSKEIASQIPEKELLLFERNDATAFKVIIDGRGKSSVSVDTGING